MHDGVIFIYSDSWNCFHPSVQCDLTVTSGLIVFHNMVNILCCNSVAHCLYFTFIKCEECEEKGER